MDQRTKPLYTLRNVNKQARTCTNLHVDSSDNNMPSRDSFDGFPTKHFQDDQDQQLQFQRSRRISHSPVTTHAQRQVVKNYSKLKKSKIKHETSQSKSKVSLSFKKNSNANQQDSQKQTIKVCYDKLSRYENIVTLTEQQNQNLKNQNVFLLQKLRKMQQRQLKVKRIYDKTKNYKARYLQIKQQIQIIKQQTHIYRSLLHDFKQITMIDIPVLKQKIRQTQQQQPIIIRDVRKKQKQLEQTQSTLKKSLYTKNQSPYGCIYQQSQQAQQKTLGSVLGVKQQQEYEQQQFQYEQKQKQIQQKFQKAD